MKNFSVARAFSAGVDLIETRPWTIAWWALAIVVLELAPRYLVSAMWGGDELGAMREVFSSAVSHDPERMRAASDHLKAAQSGHQVWGMLWLLWGFFCSAVLYNAAFRSVLEPQKRSFGYLRVGMAEFWQFLVLLALWVMILLYVAACVVLLVLIGLAAKAVGPPAGGWILGIAIGVVALITYWLMLRLSLGTVATFARRRFAYFDSWSLTKGRVWKLFWTGFLIFALVIGLYVMFLFSVVLSVVPVAGMIHPGAASGPAVSAHMPVAAAELFSVASLGVGLWLIAGSIIGAVLHALTLTPWAVAYAGVTGGDDAPH